MAQLSAEARAIVQDQMSRAARRIAGAAIAMSREEVAEGEFDNHSDGVVSAIFHIADAVELARTGVRRQVGEGDEATAIRSVLATLSAEGVGSVPGPARLIDLNYRRNASVHGDWTEILDRNSLADAIAAGRQFHRAATVYIESRGVRLT